MELPRLISSPYSVQGHPGVALVKPR